MLTLQQRIYVVQCYGLGEIALREVVRRFNERFPSTNLTRMTAMRIVKKFLATGSVLNVKKEIKKHDENDAATIVAIDSVEEHPRLSLRERSRNLNVSKSELQRIYKSNKVKPFKPKFVHTIEEGDAGRRLLFCLTIGEKCIVERNFYKNIVFSDEATFTTNGVISSQNCRYWSTNNPNFRINCRRQYYQKVNVWCAVSYRFGILGPFFIEGRLNQNEYLQLLDRFRDEYLHDLPLTERQAIYFQQDGCPAHSTARVTEWINLVFQEKWIARNGPIAWPPRSPDLTILDFFMGSPQTTGLLSTNTQQ